MATFADPSRVTPWLSIAEGEGMLPCNLGRTMRIEARTTFDLLVNELTSVHD
ncbi:MAG: hypothetical protein M3O50_17440 [Myxococcota bacterium]|nr:hypothetical protein [Myxococcota bacterium]